MGERCQILLEIIVMYLKVPYSLVSHRKVFFRCFRDIQSNAWGEGVFYNLVKLDYEALFSVIDFIMVTLIIYKGLCDYKGGLYKCVSAKLSGKQESQSFAFLIIMMY